MRIKRLKSKAFRVGNDVVTFFLNSDYTTTYTVELDEEGLFDGVWDADNSTMTAAEYGYDNHCNIYSAEMAIILVRREYFGTPYSKKIAERFDWLNGKAHGLDAETVEQLKEK